MASRTHEPEPLLTPAEVASMFRVDPKTVTRWAKAGKLRAVRTGTHAAFVDGDRPLADLLSRRAAAVAGHDEAAFLADVDPGDPRLVDRQRTEYRNLLALGLSSFTLTLTRAHDYDVSDADLVRRYGGALRE